ncbi:MAG TPA: hypothetical protein VF580_12110, partial [Thermoanaerobaculia bacterium]
MSASAAPRGPERIRRALSGGYPVVYVQSWEEGRVERALAALAQKYFEKPVPFGVWTCVDGLRVGDDRWAETSDPLRALDAVLESPGPGFFLMKDLPAFLPTRSDVVRRLRDLYRQIRGRGKFVFLLSPRLVLPEDLKKEIYLVDYDLPDDAEILFILGHLGKRLAGEAGLPDVDAKRFSTALKGLTSDEIEHVVTKVFMRRGAFDESAYDDILLEKEQASRKEGVLEFILPRTTLDDVGGLENLKEWL